jgi:hypothetical protein
MSSRFLVADSVIKSLEALDNADLDFVLNMIECTFPKKGKGTQPSGGRGRGGTAGRQGRGRGRAPLRGGPPTTAGRAAQPNNAGGGYAGGAPYGAVPQPAVVPPPANDPNILEDVLVSLELLTCDLREVTREAGADPPSMDRKSVQKRLNKKRSELQKKLILLNESSLDGYWCFESLNAIQRFRLSSSDALATDGVRLRTNPLPSNFHELIVPIGAIANERGLSGEVSNYGFYTNEDRRYRAPTEHEAEVSIGGS